MRKVWVIAVREYLAAVRTKSFVVTLVLLPVMMSGGAIAQYVLRNQVDPRPRRYAVIDRTAGGWLAGALAEAARAHNVRRLNVAPDQTTPPAFEIEPVTPPAEDELGLLRYQLSERVRKGELDGFLEVGPRILEPTPGPPLPPGAWDERTATSGPSSVPEGYALRYQTNRPAAQEFPRWASAVVRAVVQTRRAELRKVATTDIADVLRPVPFVSKGLTTRDPATGEIREAAEQNIALSILLPGALVGLMLMFVLLGAMPLLQGVVEEKMQRIAEVLLGSVAPFPLMMGKLLGMAGVSLTTASLYLTGIYGMVWYYGYAEYLPTEVLGWFLVYQVLALFLFGSIFTAVGAACTDMKEAQAMTMPVTLLIVVPMFVWIQVVREPTSTFATVISLFPTATPMLMTARLAVPPGVPTWQPLLGVALVLMTTVVCVFIGGRVFRVGFLMQGKGAQFRDLLRWAWRG